MKTYTAEYHEENETFAAEDFDEAKIHALEGEKNGRRLFCIREASRDEKSIHKMVGTFRCTAKP